MGDGVYCRTCGKAICPLPTRCGDCILSKKQQLILTVIGMFMLLAATFGIATAIVLIFGAVA